MLHPTLSLNALRAFEAAARHQNFTRAALELCVSQAALSHQIRAWKTGSASACSIACRAAWR